MNKLKFYLISSLIFVVTFIIYISNIFNGFHLKIQDQFTQWQNTPNSLSNIVIVSVDDNSMKNLNRKWPWGRTYFADVIKKIAQDKPRIIALDFTYSENSNKNEDNYFEKTLKQIDIPIVAGITLYQQVQNQVVGKQKISLVHNGLELPIFSQLQFGFLDMPLEEDKVIRKTWLVKKHNDENYYSLVLKVFLMLENIHEGKVSQEDEKLKIDRLLSIPLNNQKMFISYSGPNQTYPYISFYQVEKNLLPPGFFKNKIVFIGPTFNTAQDRHLTPFKSLMNGVEVHANILETLIQKKIYQQSSNFFNFLLFLIIHVTVFLLFILFISRKNLFLFTIGIMLIYILTAIILILGFQIIIPYHFLFTTMVLFVGGYLIRESLKNSELKKELAQLQQNSEDFSLDKQLRDYEITNREKEIILLLLKDFNNPQISKKLYISIHTVKKHITNIYQKLEINNRSEIKQKLNL